jgi:antitoxin ParD1/3/4
MATLNISLPETLHEFVERQVAEGGYGDASEYIHNLLREEANKKARDKVEALLLEGLNSGEPVEVNAQYCEEKQRQLTEKHPNGSEK